MVGELQGIFVPPNVFGQHMDPVVGAQRGGPERRTGFSKSQTHCAFVDDYSRIEKFGQRWVSLGGGF